MILSKVMLSGFIISNMASLELTITLFNNIPKVILPIVLGIYFLFILVLVEDGNTLEA